jgi:hypothetical protein
MQEVHIEDDTSESQIATLQRENWGLRDIAISAMSENANLEARLNLAIERIKQLEKIANHRNQILNSTTWKIGRLIVKPLSPLKKMLSSGQNKGEKIGQQK